LSASFGILPENGRHVRHLNENIAVIISDINQF